MTNKKSIFALLFNNTLGMMALFALIPLIAPLIREMGLQEWQAGLIIAVSGGFWMIFAPIWGRSSDKYGRRIILLSGVLGFFISYIIMTVFLHFAVETKVLSLISIMFWFVVTRSIMGIFFGAIPSTTAANIADLTTHENRTSFMAMFGASNSFGLVLGPMFAGLFASIGLLAPLYAAAVLPFVGFFVLLIFLKKDSKSNQENSFNSDPTEEKTEIKKPKLKFTDVRIRLPIITNFLVNAGSLTANMCVGYFIMDKFIQTPHQASVLLSVTLSAAGVTTILVQLTMVKMKKVAALTWIRLGSFLSLISFVSLIFAPSKLVFILIYCVAAAGMAFVMPSALSLASQSVSDKEQGAVSGSMASVQGLANLIVPLISTGIYGFNMNVPFLLTGILLGFLLFLTFKHKSTA